eukprot:jgi/Mesvir1/16798/Mv15166-RA.1
MQGSSPALSTSVSARVCGRNAMAYTGVQASQSVSGTGARLRQPVSALTAAAYMVDNRLLARWRGASSTGIISSQSGSRRLAILGGISRRTFPKGHLQWRYIGAEAAVPRFVGATASLAEEERGMPALGKDGKAASLPDAPLDLELPGGKRIVELVAAWDQLTAVMGNQGERPQGAAADVLMAALKITVGGLQNAPPCEDGRPAITRSLAIAQLLACLHCDPETIAAGMLRQLVHAGALLLPTVEATLGASVAQLLHDSARVRELPWRADAFDDDNARTLRQFCLAFHDVRAVVVELAARVDTMRHLSSLPPYQAQILALETMQIYAPMAHALGCADLTNQLEDAAFQRLFPESYASVAGWLRREEAASSRALEQCRAQLAEAIAKDEVLGASSGLLCSYELLSRTKSLFSTMKKLVRDGRGREEVYDRLGLRLVLTPQRDEDGPMLCYRALELVQQLGWDEVPGRRKDYIKNPKGNGYQSLHVTFTVAPASLDDEAPGHATPSDPTGDASSSSSLRSPLVELQIRTREMDVLAEAGVAAHGAYKGGLTDPEQVKQLRAFTEAAARVASLRFGSVVDPQLLGEDAGAASRADDTMFALFDKNGDGYISPEELRAVMGELGADERDADVAEMMRAVDENSDGRVSKEEFLRFTEQVSLRQSLTLQDRSYLEQLGSTIGEGKDASSSTEVVVAASVATTTAAMEGSSRAHTVHAQHEPAARLPEAKTDDHSGNHAQQRRPQSEVSVPSPSSSLMQFSNAQAATAAASSAWASSPSSGSMLTSALVSPPGLKKKKRVKVPAVHALEEAAPPSDVRDDSRSNQGGEEMQAGGVASARMGAEGAVPAAAGGDVSRGDAEEEGAGLPASAPGGPRDASIAPHKRAAKMLKAGDEEGARKFLEQSLEANPGDENLWIAFAQLEAAKGMIARARDHFREALSVAKQRGDKEATVDTIKSWAMMEADVGNTSTSTRLFEDALDAASESLLLDDGSSVVRVSAAGVRTLHAWAQREARSGHIPTARSLFKRAARVAPTNPYVLQGWAQVEAKAGNMAAARTLFQAGVDAAPQDTRLWQSWGVAEAGAGDLGAARRKFEEGLKVNPKNCYIYQAWGVAEARAGEIDRARTLFQKAVDIDPTNVPSWQAWAKLEEEQGEQERALELYGQGLAVDARNLFCLHACARLERLRGRIPAARALLRRCLLLDEKNAPTLQEWGTLEQAMGNEELAKELFARAKAAETTIVRRVKSRGAGRRKKRLFPQKSSQKPGQ